MLLFSVLNQSEIRFILCGNFTVYSSLLSVFLVEKLNSLLLWIQNNRHKMSWAILGSGRRRIHVLPKGWEVHWSSNSHTQCPRQLFKQDKVLKVECEEEAPHSAPDRND